MHRLREIQQIHASNRLIIVFRSKVRGIEIAAIKGEQAAIKKLLRKDHSRTARRVAKTLHDELAQVSHGQRLPDLLGIGSPPGTSVRRTKMRSFPPPKPFGGIFKPGRALTLACPGKGTVGTPLPVSGNLSPAIASAKISVVYQHAKETIDHRAITDSKGHFTDSAVPDSSGAWTVVARYKGDTVYGPSSSPTCSVHVGP